MSRQRQVCDRHLAHGRGQGLVEFSLVAPVFFLIFFGIIQFGITFAQHSAFVFALRDAARVASIHTPETDPAGAATLHPDGYWADDLVCQSLIHSLRSSAMNPSDLTQVEIYNADPKVAAGDPVNKGDGYTPSPLEATVGDLGSCALDGTFVPVKEDYLPCRRDTVDPPGPIGVAATYRFRPFIGLFDAFFGNGSGLALRDTSTLRIEPKFAPGTQFQPVTRCPSPT